MKCPPVAFLNKLRFAGVPSGELADYAYALVCCQFPASAVGGGWHQAVDGVCSQKLAELRGEINRRAGSGEKTDALTHALDVIDGTAGLAGDNTRWVSPSQLSRLSDSALIGLHSMSRCRGDMRRGKGMEAFTRSYQWRIVNELLSRNESGPLAQILLLAECLEADNYANICGLPYKMGQAARSFAPSDFASDEELRSHISELVRKADYVSREELIQIADYIQTEIVEKGETSGHMPLVNAILRTGMPYFNYPKIVRGLESAAKSLAKTKEMHDIELAPYFHTLWDLTQKPTYLSRFEKAVRQCYLTLAANRHYPGLGVDKEDSDSLASALRFLDDHRLSVWVLNEKYDVDKVIAKYRTA